MAGDSVHDQELLKRYVKHGDKAAFAKIYEKYVDQLYRFVFVRMGNTEQAEDIVSDTFMTLITILPNYRGDSSLKTFIFGVALNKMRAFWQNQAKLKLTQLEEYMAASIAEEDAASTSQKLPKLRQHLPQVLSKLTQTEQQVITERFVNVNDIKETAEKLGLTSANVRVIQHRAIKKASKLANSLILNQAKQHVTGK